MIWNAEQDIQLRPAEGTSGVSLICVPTSAGCFIGDKMEQLLYHQTEKAKTANRKAVARYQKTEKGRKANYKRVLRYQLRYPERRKARNVVEYAIFVGKIPRPNILQCHYGNHPAKEYHHHKGYESEHWLDVVPACQKCHTEVHLKRRNREQT